MKGLILISHVILKYSLTNPTNNAMFNLYFYGLKLILELLIYILFCPVLPNALTH